MPFLTCSGCARHVRAEETLCPFCGANELRARVEKGAIPSTVRLGAAIATMGAALAGTDCGTDIGTVVPAYGMFGIPLDAGPDARDATVDGVASDSASTDATSDAEEGDDAGDSSVDGSVDAETDADLIDAESADASSDATGDAPDDDGGPIPLYGLPP